MTSMERIQACQTILDRIQLESRRPVCRVGLSRTPFAITDSHLGGVPYVPHREEIPTDLGGSQLWLCAQINFAQMPAIEGFPREGLLQIFLSDRRIDGGFGLRSAGAGRVQDYWRAVYYPEIDWTVTEEECRAKMVIPWEEASKTNMPRPACQWDLREIAQGVTKLWRAPEVPLKVNFGPVEQEGVCIEDFRFQEAFDRAARELWPGELPRAFYPFDIWDQTEEEREALVRVRNQCRNGGCKLGGFPLFLRGDPREGAPELAAWDTLLFQLDDDGFYFPAGDIGDADLNLNTGALNFLIRSEDLKNRDFSRIIGQFAYF